MNKLDDEIINFSLLIFFKKYEQKDLTFLRNNYEFEKICSENGELEMCDIYKLCTEKVKALIQQRSLLKLSRYAGSLHRRRHNKI